jgi:preprotein translocase subunit SecD
MGGGTAQYQLDEATLLVNVLRTGSLPASLQEEQSSEVGPLLGEDAISKAKVSFALGAFLVFIIMVVYYRMSGFISIIALSLNITHVCYRNVFY